MFTTPSKWIWKKSSWKKWPILFSYKIVKSLFICWRLSFIDVFLIIPCTFINTNVFTAVTCKRSCLLIALRSRSFGFTVCCRSCLLIALGWRSFAFTVFFRSCFLLVFYPLEDIPYLRHETIFIINGNFLTCKSEIQITANELQSLRCKGHEISKQLNHRSTVTSWDGKHWWWVVVLELG